MVDLDVEPREALMGSTATCMQHATLISLLSATQNPQVYPNNDRRLTEAPHP